MDIGKIHPTAYQRMMKLDQDVTAALAAAGVQPLLVELVRIRVSQINGCAFCLRLHTREAVGQGRDRRSAGRPRRLVGVPVLHRAGTRCARARRAGHVARCPESRTWDDGSLTEEQASAVAWLATAMNAWNRIAITSHYPVGP